MLHPTVVIQHSFIEVSGDLCYSWKLVSCWGLLMPSGQWLQIPYAEYITWAMYYEASSADPGRVFCYLDSFTPSLSIRISGHMNLVINLPSCVFPARSHERVGHY